MQHIPRKSKRKALSPGHNPPFAKKAPVAPVVTVKKPPTAKPLTLSEKAATQGLSGVTSYYFSRAELEELEAEEESSNSNSNSNSSSNSNSRPAKRQGTRSSSVAGNGAAWDGTPAAAEGADSAAQLELLSNAEGELRVSFDAHMKYLSEVGSACIVNG
ncbi:unnamed protein product [Hapterophycus canaliculatus]